MRTFDDIYSKRDSIEKIRQEYAKDVYINQKERKESK